MKSYQLSWCFGIKAYIFYFLILLSKTFFFCFQPMAFLLHLYPYWKHLCQATCTHCVYPSKMWVVPVEGSVFLHVKAFFSRLMSPPYFLFRMRHFLFEPHETEAYVCCCLRAKRPALSAVPCQDLWGACGANLGGGKSNSHFPWGL